MNVVILLSSISYSAEKPSMLQKYNLDSYILHWIISFDVVMLFCDVLEIISPKLFIIQLHLKKYAHSLCFVVFGSVLCGTWAHFIKFFFIIIQIRWKLCSALI